jgi:hypothetical protein
MGETSMKLGITCKVESETFIGKAALNTTIDGVEYTLVPNTKGLLSEISLKIKSPDIDKQIAKVSPLPYPSPVQHAMTIQISESIVNLFVKMRDNDELEGEKQWKDNEKSIVNLFVKMRDNDELEGEKQWKDNEKWGGLYGYAICLTPVTIFHCWNRRCKMARYSPARKRCLCGWKCPVIGPKAERKRCACLADLNRRIFFSRKRVGW